MKNNISWRNIILLIAIFIISFMGSVYAAPSTEDVATSPDTISILCSAGGIAGLLAVLLAGHQKEIKK